MKGQMSKIKCEECNKLCDEYQTLLNKCSMCNTEEELLDWLNNEDLSKKEKRKNADYQWSEFVIFLILYYHSKINKKNLRNESNIHKIPDISILLKIYNNEKENICKLNEHIEKFIEDLKEQKKEDVKEYIQNFYSEFDFCEKYSIFKVLETTDNKIKNVYLTGKSIKIIKNINQSLYSKISGLQEKDRKGDVFVELNNGEYIGISIKKDKKCQFTNWSIDKIMLNVSDKTDKFVLKKIRKDVLDSICDYDTRRKNSSEENRRITKNLMYEKDKRMDLWKEKFDTFITSKYPNIFISKIIDGISQVNNLPFKLFTYNGEKLIDNSKIKNFLEKSKISIIRDYLNFDKKKYNNIKTHFSENAAKMWYFIKVNNEIKYRFEVRSKGGQRGWDNSPQILIFNI
tara:strand:- start:1156 stop:2355 length:1200 start_codon:yes stop_codon:yes gene_type:complete